MNVILDLNDYYCITLNNKVHHIILHSPEVRWLLSKYGIINVVDIVFNYTNPQNEFYRLTCNTLIIYLEILN